jgi:hypothetical protein
MGWQKSTGYNRRSRVVAQMGEQKSVIGRALRAGNFKISRPKPG